MCLIIVQVGAITVNFFAEVMSCSMDKSVAKAGNLNNSSGLLVDFPASDWIASLNPLDDEVDCGITCCSSYIKYF